MYCKTAFLAGDLKKLSLSQLLALRILTKDFPTTSVGCVPCNFDDASLRRYGTLGFFDLDLEAWDGKFDEWFLRTFVEVKDAVRFFGYIIGT